MTDNISKYGFRWEGYRDGSPGTQPTVEGFFATAYAATTAHMRVGDPLKLVNDGSVALAAAGDAVDYILAGIVRYYDGTKMTTGPYLPSGTTWTTQDRQCRVLMTPVTAGRWRVCVDDIVTATTEATYQALVQENCDHSINTDATAYKNNPRLDISTHTTSTAQWRIVEVPRTFNNLDYADHYVELVVVINETNLAPWTATGV